MRVTRTREGWATIEDLTPEQFLTLLDALDELNRPDNPVRPFAFEFQQVVDVLTWRLSQGVALFSIDAGTPPGIPRRFRLRVVGPHDDSL